MCTYIHQKTCVSMFAAALFVTTLIAALQSNVMKITSIILNKNTHNITVFTRSTKPRKLICAVRNKDIVTLCEEATGNGHGGGASGSKGHGLPLDLGVVTWVCSFFCSFSCMDAIVYCRKIRWSVAFCFVQVSS